jgi:hypothetical protein
MAADATKKTISVLLKLTPEQTERLTSASIRSGRSKTREAHLRLDDHLKMYPVLAVPVQDDKNEDS